jgi:hypothetical protein
VLVSNVSIFEKLSITGDINEYVGSTRVDFNEE